MLLLCKHFRNTMVFGQMQMGKHRLSSATTSLGTSATTTRSPTNTSDPRHSRSVLSAGAIYGITVRFPHTFYLYRRLRNAEISLQFGSVSVISVVLIVCYAMYRRRRRRGYLNSGSFVTDGINPNEAGQTRNTNMLESLAMVSPCASYLAPPYNVPSQLESDNCCSGG